MILTLYGRIKKEHRARIASGLEKSLIAVSNDRVPLMDVHFLVGSAMLAIKKFVMISG